MKNKFKVKTQIKNKLFKKKNKLKIKIMMIQNDN